MELVYYALDNEFAVATGNNVNVQPGYSRFDYPPNSTRDLIITSNAGDSDPRHFEVGDTYDVAFSGNGGSTLEDATVVRSDLAPGGGGIIVFEGLDAKGDLTQVIWTPDFDLENWYWTYYSPSNPPNFYTTDQNATYSHTFVCFHAQVPIATPRGLVPAARLQPGETVCTWSGQKQEVLWVGRRTVVGEGGNAPIRFDKGSIGNFKPIMLSPQHRVLVTHPRAREIAGAREILVPAVSLVNGETIRRNPRPKVTYVHLLLPVHAVLVAAGAPCESLFPGPVARKTLGPELDAQIRDILDGGEFAPAHPMLTAGEARKASLDWRVAERTPAMF